jgi:hypothetical protein
VLQGLESLGVNAKLFLPEDDEDIMRIELSMFTRGTHYDGPDDTTYTVHEMINALAESYCPECALSAVVDGDFSALARATVRPEKHPKRKRATVAGRPVLNH